MAETVYLKSWPDLDPLARKNLIDEYYAQGYRAEGSYSVYSTAIPKLIKYDVQPDGFNVNATAPLTNIDTDTGSGQLVIGIDEGRQGIAWYWYAAALAGGGALAYLLRK